MNTYATAAAFKQAVETRLRSSSSSGVDFARRRQLLVFGRFLARIAHELGDAVLLKGGLVVELRVQRARTTKSLEAAEDSPKPPAVAAGKRRISLDEFLAARLTPPPGVGPISLEDMDRAIAEGAIGRGSV